MSLKRNLLNAWANLAAITHRTSAGRRRVRDRIKFRGMVCLVGQNKLPMEKYNERINVAFCFDDNGYKLAAVAIKSLIMASHNSCDYDIYCVADDGVSDAHRKKISSMVSGTESRVIFLNANHDFDNSYCSKWPIAVYFRTMLPKLLPDVKKIIYADIDVLFCTDLVDLWRTDMGKNILAGVIERSNRYINSGVLVMNLEQIRKDNLYEKWVAASQKKRYQNPDQDLLNYTAYGRIIYLPLKYNFQPRLGSRIFKIFSDMEINDLKYNLVVLHFSSRQKPWYDAEQRPMYSDLWWNVANTTGLYNK